MQAREGGNWQFGDMLIFILCAVVTGSQVNYYSPKNLVPTAVMVNLQGASGLSSYKMQLVLGSGDSGQYYVDVVVPRPIGCLGYSFTAVTADGAFSLPESGYYGTLDSRINCNQNHLTTLTTTVNTTLSPFFPGATGGNYFAFTCPDGGYIINLSGRVAIGALIHQVRVSCGAGDSFITGGSGGNVVTNPSCRTGFTGVDVEVGLGTLNLIPRCGGSPFSSLGNSPPNPSTPSFTCPPGTVFTGVSGYSDTIVNSIRLHCDIPAAVVLPANADYNSVLFGIVGSDYKPTFDFRCPEGEYIINFSGEAEVYIVAINVACSGGGFFTTRGAGFNLVSNGDCPGGLDSAYVAYNTDTVVGSLAPHFLQLQVACNGGPTSALGLSRFPSSTGNVQGSFTCPAGMRLVGIRGSANLFLDNLGFACAQGPFIPPLLTPGPNLLTVSPLYGTSPRGSWFTFNCDPGDYVVSLGAQSLVPGFINSITHIGVACAGGKRLGQTSYDCPQGFTGSNLRYYGFSGGIRQIMPVCNNGQPHDLVDWLDGDKSVDESFTCPTGQRIAGITGYTGKVVYSISFTCGTISRPANTASPPNVTDKSYDLVEPYPDCYFKLGSEYCPKPYEGFHFADIYMVSNGQKTIPNALMNPAVCG